MSSYRYKTTCPTCKQAIERVFALRPHQLLQCANCHEILLVTQPDPLVVARAFEQLEGMRYDHAQSESTPQEAPHE